VGIQRLAADTGPHHEAGLEPRLLIKRPDDGGDG
jgi:hypothetical protein